MVAVQPICVISEGEDIHRSGHHVGDGKIALVYHDEPGSPAVTVVVGHSKTGSVPMGKTVRLMLEGSDGPEDPAYTLAKESDTVFDGASTFADVTEWSERYWWHCQDLKSASPGSNPGGQTSQT